MVGGEVKEPSDPDPRRSSSLASLLTEDRFLREWLRMKTCFRGGMGMSASPSSHLGRLRRQVLDGQYRPSPLRRFQVAKASGGMRELGVPSASDRVVQGVVNRIASSRLDPMFLENVHGYRPGRSVQMALEHLQSQAGVRDRVEILKADVEGLFDHLRPELLVRAVESAWADPLWVHLNRQWMKAWSPQGGVPQGVPLSPLLANLYLHDPVDRHLHLLGMGMGWIRYGDDFVMVTSAPGGSLVLGRHLASLLRRVGLRLSSQKTEVVQAGRGIPPTILLLGQRVGFEQVAGGWRVSIGQPHKKRMFFGTDTETKWGAEQACWPPCHPFSRWVEPLPWRRHPDSWGDFQGGERG